MKNQVEDIIDTLILNHFLNTYRNFNIMSGGDISKASKTALATFKNSICMGSIAKIEVLKDEFRMYIDFHEQRDGLLDEEEKYKEKYIEYRDNEANDKANEILRVAKDIIRDSWKK